MRRRLVAIALLLAPIGQAALARASSAAPFQGCDEHICFCPSHSAAGGPAAAPPSCHDDQARRPAQHPKLQASCSHQAPPTLLPTTTPYVLPGSAALEPERSGAPARLTAGACTIPGFARIDSPPPRPAPHRST